MTFETVKPLIAAGSMQACSCHSGSCESGSKVASIAVAKIVPAMPASKPKNDNRASTDHFVTQVKACALWAGQRDVNVNVTLT
jgi:hypothetical protein